MSLCPSALRLRGTFLTGSPSSRRIRAVSPASISSRASLALTKLVGQLTPRRSMVCKVSLPSIGNPYLGHDNLGRNGPGYRVLGELHAEVVKERLRPLLDDRVAQPDAPETFGLLLVP